MAQIGALSAHLFDRLIVRLAIEIHEAEDLPLDQKIAAIGGHGRLPRVSTALSLTTGQALVCSAPNIARRVRTLLGGLLKADVTPE
jgi:hypothetical protein